MPKVKFTAIVIYGLRYGNHEATHNRLHHHEMNVDCVNTREEIVRYLIDKMRNEYKFADGKITIYIQDINVLEGQSWKYLPER